MAISLTCRCGRIYHIGEENAGKILKCNYCEHKMKIPEVTAQPPLSPPLDDDLYAFETPHHSPASFQRYPNDPIFHRDIFRFFFKPKIAANDRFEIYDESGDLLMVAEIPLRAGRGFLWFISLLGILTVSSIGIVLGIILYAEKRQIPLDNIFTTPVFIGLGILLVVGSIGLGIALSSKRTIQIWGDANRRKRLLEVQENNKIRLFYSHYTIYTADGSPLACMKTNFLDNNLFRQRWRCSRPGGELLCIIRSGPVNEAISEKLFSLFAPFIEGRYNLIDPQTEVKIGYIWPTPKETVLDMSSDPHHLLNRQIAAAMAIVMVFNNIHHHIIHLPV